MSEYWCLTICSKSETVGHVHGAEKPLREALESWAADSDGNLTSQKVFTVSGFDDTFARSPMTLAIVADEIKCVTLRRCG